MPVNAQLLAKEMLAATNQATDAFIAQQKLGDAIGKHIMKNALVMFSWVAVKPVPPPPTPDPVVIATGKISNIAIMLKPTKVNKPGMGLQVMALQIQQGVMKGLYKPNSPWTTSPGSMVSVPPPVLTMSMVANREASMLHLATEIVTWITSYVPSVPCAGARGAYIGVATPTKIL